MIRFTSDDVSVSDVRFDSVRIVAFQGADDIALGCRWLERAPVGECSIQRSPEGWGRGIDLNHVSDFVFENGEISCFDEIGKEGLEDIRAQGLYMASDGAKAATGCSNFIVRNSEFYACGHNNLMFSNCDSVLVEHNYFENELHRSLGFTRGRGHTVRYNTFAAWERRRVELQNSGGNALQLRSAGTRVHHNLFYGGGERDHQGAITVATLDTFLVADNEIFNNVMLGFNSTAFLLNDKRPPPFNLVANKIYNNIFVGQETNHGVFHWVSDSHEEYLDGQTYGNQIRNNIFYSPSGDSEVISAQRFGWQGTMLSEDDLNDLAVASGNIYSDPGFVELSFEAPDFRIDKSCVAYNTGLPIDVPNDFAGTPLETEIQKTGIGAYVVGMAPLAAPADLSPAQGEEGLPPYTTFSWSQVDSADGYHFLVATDSLFTEPLIESRNLQIPKTSLSTPLAYNTKHYWRVRAAGFGGQEFPVSTRCTTWSPTQGFTVAVGTPIEEEGDLPDEFELLGNFANPFARTTTIRYTLPRSAHVRLIVLDSLGRQVAVLKNGSVVAGSHSAQWDAAAMAGGAYFIHFEAGGTTDTRAILLVPD
jgi:hypothetical protein